MKFSVKSITPALRLTHASALLFIVLLWAGIYLPGLGTLQLQHEEPRRALPALHMLASGDWLVPRVGSEPYLRKPPLLNWAIALSCKWMGSVSEWAVRLPSVLATLALAATIVGVAGRRWLGKEGGLIAGIFFLVNFTMIESGRLAELEALYVAMTGIALVLWMTSWRKEAGSWQLWLLPAPFLALGMLTKGPTHLIFYYGVVLPVLFFGRNTRSLLHPAHILSLILIFGALLCWAVPCSLAVSNHNPLGVWGFWWRQLASRASAESDPHFRLSVWLLNGPQTLKNFLPWTLMLPLLWRKETMTVVAGTANSVPRDLALFRGARFGVAVTAILMILLPNGSPRYIYPLIVVPCLLLGRALTVDEGSGNPTWIEPIWRWLNLLFLAIVSLGVMAMPLFAREEHWILLWTCMMAVLVAGIWFSAVQRRARSPSVPSSNGGRLLLKQAVITGAVTALAMMTFAILVMPRIDSANKHRSREVAGMIRAALPAGAELWVLEDNFRPFWYYLEPKVRYFRSLADLPAQAHYILLPATQVKVLLQNPIWQNAPPTFILQAVDNENKAFDLYARHST